MHPTVDTRVRWLLAALAALSCTGTVAENPGPRPGDKDPAGPVSPPAKPGMQPVAPGEVSAAVAPLRRLTRAQYLNTVRDLLGLTGVVGGNALPADDAINDRFHSNTVTPVQTIDVGKYADAADVLATKAVAGANLATLVPCAPQGDAACAKTFIDTFGKRAYRRPLTADEAAHLQALYTSGGDFPTGIRLVIAGLLQSPKFLYLAEPVPATAAGKVVGVDAWALASRLSYFFLDTMPDDALFTAAEKGRLSSADQVAEQANRLMADPRFRATVFTFHQEWLQLDTLPGTEKDPQAFPQWTPALRDALGEETRRFVEYVFTDGDRRLDTLLSAPFSFVDATLAAHYGVPAAAGWQRVDLPKDQRAGLLTQAGLMATLAHENRTSFILRGKMVREALFCAEPLLPPADVPPEPKFDPMASAKARSEAHRKDPACATCHELFDPIGFAFEIYDATGRYRTTDGAGPIDSKVTLSHTAQLDGKVAANAVELVRLLAGADEVRDCVARQWLRFGLGRDDAKEDEPSLAAAVKAFKEGGAKLPALLVSIARSDAFRFQKVDQ
jgi:hypothetical protein